MAESALHEKALANGGKFDSGPITRNLATGWGSPCTMRRWVSGLVWGRYYIVIVRDALLQGGGWPAIWLNVLVIGFMGLVLYGVAWRGVRRMQLSY